MVIEIPNLLMPNGKAYLKKLMLRMRNFALDVEGPMLIAIVIAAVVKETGLLNFVAGYLEPLVSSWVGFAQRGGHGVDPRCCAPGNGSGSSPGD